MSSGALNAGVIVVTLLPYLTVTMNNFKNYFLKMNYFKKYFT